MKWGDFNKSLYIIALIVKCVKIIHAGSALRWQCYRKTEASINVPPQIIDLWLLKCRSISFIFAEVIPPILFYLFLNPNVTNLTYSNLVAFKCQYGNTSWKYILIYVFTVEKCLNEFKLQYRFNWQLNCILNIIFNVKFSFPC